MDSPVSADVTAPAPDRARPLAAQAAPSVADVASFVADRTGLVVVDSAELVGGMVAYVWRLGLADGRTVVGKAARGDRAHLDLEAAMLTTLHAACPSLVPEVIYADPELLLQTFMPGEHLADAAGPSLGRRLAELHGHTAAAYGFEEPTLNGWFVLPNGWSSSWVDFFRDRRLRYCADAAVANRTLSSSFRARIETLCERLPGLLTEPDQPSLLHGDLWRANILSVGQDVTALIDPSVLYGHPELDLSLIVDQPYTDRVLGAYRHHRTIDRDFIDVRAPIYRVYPAIMHVLYFGQRYEGWLDRTLSLSGV